MPAAHIYSDIIMASTGIQDCYKYSCVNEGYDK